MTGALAQLGGLGGIAALLTSIGTLWGIIRVKKDTGQLRPNHGSSVADGINRLEAAVRSLGHQLGEVRRDMSDERADRRAADDAIADRLTTLENRRR